MQYSIISHFFPHILIFSHFFPSIPLIPLGHIFDKLIKYWINQTHDKLINWCQRALVVETVIIFFFLFFIIFLIFFYFFLNFYI